MSVRVEMIGRTFGRLTVLDLHSVTEANRRRWICSCECGGQTVAAGQELRRGNVRSCGCLRREHGLRIIGKVRAALPAKFRGVAA
jgi:hypothetical protein